MPVPLALIAAALEIAKLAAPKLVRHLTDSDTAAATAERVIGIAQQVTGTATPDAALAKLHADPNLVVQMNIRSQEIEADVEKAYLADRQSARARDMEYVRAGAKNRRADWMVALDVFGLIACLIVIVFLRKELEGDVVILLSTIATYFGLSLRDAHQFEFGSSRGSQSKDEILARGIKGQG